MTSLTPQTPRIDDPDIRLKRLRFHCWHRGFREMDLILGNFADRHLTEQSTQDLDDLEDLLNQPDQDVYQWIIGNQPVPTDFDTPIFSRLQKLDFMEAEGAGGANRIKG
jgi:antitoxin CptB